MLLAAAGHLEASRGWRRPVALLSATIPLAMLFRLLARDAPIALSMSASAALGLLFITVSYRHASDALKLLIRTLVIITAVYLFTSHPYFIPDRGIGEKNFPDGVLIDAFFWVAMLFSAGSLYLPSLTVLPFSFLICLKSTMAETTGINISKTDYIILPELGIVRSYCKGSS
jgi:hypothetical protein